MALTDDRPGLAGQPPDEELTKMTLFEHLAELRKRLIVTIVALVVTTAAAYFLDTHAIDFRLGPYCTFVRHNQSKSISGCNLVT
ncbi:MAG: twin-arginine translocase subunit TatC, partial [Acidimicrobiales bacterium]